MVVMGVMSDMLRFEIRIAWGSDGFDVLARVGCARSSVDLMMSLLLAADMLQYGTRSVDSGLQVGLRLVPSGLSWMVKLNWRGKSFGGVRFRPDSDSSVYRPDSG